MRKRWLLVVPAALVLGPLTGWICIVNYSDYQARKTILQYEVPNGFSGWITIKYGVAQAPELPFEPNGIGGTYTFRIPETGYLETRSPMYLGRHTARYFRSERGGAVLIQWEPSPFFLRSEYTQKCTLIYVPVLALGLAEDPPPYPNNGCDQ